MKKLTCSDLGGSCDAEITGDTFEEVGKKSYEHVMGQINSGDEAHTAVASKMANATPEEQKAMMAEYKKKYDEAPDM
jgi:predicted small metal-binding protein